MKISGQKKLNGGFLALTTALVVSGVILVAVSVSLFQSVGYNKSSSSQEMSARALSLSEACAEHALMQLKKNSSYDGNETIQVTPDSDCKVVGVEGGGGADWTIKTKATYKNHVQRLKVVVTGIDPKIKVSSWEKVTSF